MGDNIYLGDRDGVRTPMQWTPDRNGGFSRADFAQLYLPPLMDPVYGYQAVNVEAEMRDPTSFLHWLKRMLEVRRAAPGVRHRRVRGPRRREPVGARVVRRRPRPTASPTISCCASTTSAASPSRSSSRSAVRGLVPVELLGRVPFPPIGELPYFVTLARLRLLLVRAAVAARRPVVTATEVVPAEVVERMISRHARTAATRPHGRQRWYGSGDVRPRPRRGHRLRGVAARLRARAPGLVQGARRPTACSPMRTRNPTPASRCSSGCAGSTSTCTSSTARAARCSATWATASGEALRLRRARRR